MADVKAIAQKPLKSLDTLGEQLKFYVTAVAWMPRAVRRHGRRSRGKWARRRCA